MHKEKEVHKKLVRYNTEVSEEKCSISQKSVIIAKKM